MERVDGERHNSCYQLDKPFIPSGILVIACKLEGTSYCQIKSTVGSTGWPFQEGASEPPKVNHERALQKVGDRTFSTKRTL